MYNEDDISAKEEVSPKSAWLQKENVNSQRQKSIICQKSKG